MRPKLTNEIIDARLIEQNRSIKRIDSSQGTKHSIKWQCITCSHIWINKPNNIFSLHQGCPKCAGQLSRTNNDIDKEINKQNRSIKRISSTLGDSVSIKWQCLTCSYTWKATPTKILKSKTGCPKCAGRPKLTNEIIDARLIEQNRSIKRISEYVNANTKIKWQCTLDTSHFWEATPKDVTTTRQTGCPHCRTGIFGHTTESNGKLFRSRREADSYTLLLNYFEDIDIECQKRYNNKTRHTCDFYIKSKQWWIEIGNIKTEAYLHTLKQKKLWVNQKHELWLQFDSKKTLADFLEKENE